MKQQRRGGRGREENWKISFVNKFSNLETAEIKFVCSHYSTVDCIKFVPLNGRLE